MSATPSPLPESSLTTACILAGGQGRRMKHLDKGLQDFQHQALIAHVIARIRPQVSHLILNANRNLDAYAQWGYPVYADTRPDFAGPLAGMETALQQCQTPWLLTVPCDTPFLPATLFAHLAQALVQEKADLAIAITGEAPHFQAHSACCLMPVRLLPHLHHFLNQGGRKIDAWYASLTVAFAHFEEAQAFTNINTLSELAYMEKQPMDTQPERGTI